METALKQWEQMANLLILNSCHIGQWRTTGLRPDVCTLKSLWQVFVDSDDRNRLAHQSSLAKDGARNMLTNVLIRLRLHKKPKQSASWLAIFQPQR